MTSGFRHVYSGKVRELYQGDDGVVLLVATDRISAFDYVLQTPIPDKGKILTRLSQWWFSRLADIVPNHLVDAPVPEQFAGRAMACRPLSMLPVECVARGYLTGTGLADYRRDGAIAGVALPAGLTDGSRLSEPIFDPDSKAPQGQHDENLRRLSLPPSSARTPPLSSPGSPWLSTSGARIWRPLRASSSPIRSSSLASTRR